MENKNFDVDTLLRNTLKSSEKPDMALVHKLKNYEKEERCTMKNRKFMKSSLVAAILIGVFVVSAAFAAPAIWRHLDAQIIEGEEFVNEFTVKESEEGTIWGIDVDMEALEAAGGRVVVEVDGGYTVILDQAHFDDLDEAIGSFGIRRVRTPDYIPEGFGFQRATFPVNPATNPDANHMFADFINDEDNIRIHTIEWDSDWGISIICLNQEDITINGNIGAITDGTLMVIIDDVLYTIDAPSLTRAELIRIAESLR